MTALNLMSWELGEDPRGTDNPFSSLRDTIAFSSADWTSARDLAWIYALVCGLDGDEEDPEGCMDEVAQRFGWPDAKVARLRRLHAAFVASEAKFNA